MPRFPPAELSISAPPAMVYLQLEHNQAVALLTVVSLALCILILPQLSFIFKLLRLMYQP